LQTQGNNIGLEAVNQAYNRRTISGLESDLDLEQERLKALLAELAKIFQNPLYARERFI